MQTTEHSKHFPHDSTALPSRVSFVFRAYQFHRSVTQSKSISSALVLAVNSLFAVPLFYQTANSESDDNLPYFSLLWVLFGISVLSSIYCAMDSSVSPNSVPNFIYTSSASLFVGLLHIFSTLMNSKCSSRSSRTNLCSELTWNSYEALQLTEATMLAVLFQPLMHACVDVNGAFISGPASITINWMSSIASLLASNILAPSPVRAIILSAYAVFSLLFLPFFIIRLFPATLTSQNDYQDASSITVKSQQDSSDTEGRISAAVDAKSTEMRHMIANVAHDLKTPLSSFMVGVDLIKQMIRSCEEQLQYSQQVSVDDIFLLLHNIDDYVSDIKNTNSFMVMTINRVLDYAKASKGMKLVPKFETIQLFETISLPIQCMKNVQDKVLIQFDKLPEEISSQIITDKQWLQENVLCLLSNAAKYSSGGVVTISVRLVDEQPEMASTSPCVTTVSNEPCSATDDVDIENHCSKPPLNAPTTKVVSKPTAGTPMSTTLVRTFFGPLARRISSTFRLNSITPSDALDEDCKDHPAVAASITSASVPVHSDTSLRQLQLASENSFNESSSVARSGVFSVRGAVQDNRYLLFEVEDTGIGMSEEAMASLFNPFKQTQKLAGGTGLGLFSLAKRVDALKGRFGVRHRRDGKQGSLFWFTVPYRPDEVAAEEEQRLFRRAQRQRLKEMGIVNQSEGMPKLESVMSSASQSPRSQLPASLRPQMLRICASEDSSSSSSVAVSVLPAAVSLKGMRLLRSPTAAVLLRGKVPSPTHFANSHRPSTLPSSTKVSSPNGVSLKASSPGSVRKAAFKILIAEDSPTLAKAQSMMLRRQGHRVHIAENGAIALRMYEESLEDELSRYDFILMDLQMPVMDGLEAIKRIRAREAMHPNAAMATVRHQFIIGVSADCSEEIIEEVHQIGADGFLAKPFAIASFESLGEELIASFR